MAPDDTTTRSTRREPRRFTWSVATVDRRDARRARDAMDGSGGDTSGCGITPQPPAPSTRRRQRR